VDVLRKRAPPLAVNSLFSMHTSSSTHQKLLRASVRDVQML